MSQKRSNFVERRLYEYTFHAVSSPLHVNEGLSTRDDLIAYVGKLFNVDPNEVEEKRIRFLSSKQTTIILSVDVKRARNLPGEDQDGLSDPYCKVTIMHNSIKSDAVREPKPSTSSLTPSTSPRQSRKHKNLLSCIGVGESKSNHLRPPSENRSRRSSKSSRSSDSRLGSDEGSSVESMEKFRKVSYRTEIKPKTVNPEWNEHFEFNIENVNEQQLLITVLDSDCGEKQGMKTVIKEKRGFQGTFRGIRDFLKGGQIEDDFLGEISFDIRTLAKFDHEQWFPLTGPKKSRQTNDNKSRGEILLGLKVHFKLQRDQVALKKNQWKKRFFIKPQDGKNSEDPQESISSSLVQFRRRNSTASSSDHSRSSIIFWPSIIRSNFRQQPGRSSNPPRQNSIKDQIHVGLNLIDNVLTPVDEKDTVVLIEEYHQLCRIVFLHNLEDIRDSLDETSTRNFFEWNRDLNELSKAVLLQFRVLYNISTLSEAFIKLMVIMELRCSPDYNIFVSQPVIESYATKFFDKIHEKTDGNDLEFTDYEKATFRDIFHLFINHYRERVGLDAPWFLPSIENLKNIEQIFNMLTSLTQLNICSKEPLFMSDIQDVIKARLRKDIADLFAIEPFDLNEKSQIQLNTVKSFVDFVKKIDESMLLICQYNQLFQLFGGNYVKTCFFEPGSAADRLAENIQILLTVMKEYFRSYAKPMTKPTSSIYDPNLIQGSGYLLNLYIYTQRIINALKNSFEPRDWQTNAFKMRLIDFRQWYAPLMDFLVEGFIVHIRQAMERAVENDDDSSTDEQEEVALFSESSIAATNLCVKICQDWELIDYQDPNTRYMAMIRLTNTICEQCQYYARRISTKLSENHYYPDLNKTGSFNVSKKLCILVNDIEYVKRSVLSALPRLLNFSSVIERMRERYDSTSFDNTLTTLNRLIQTAEREMTQVIQVIFDHVAKLVHVSLQSKIVNYYRDEKHGRSECITEVIRYVDQQILQNLYQGLEIIQYAGIARTIRMKTLDCLRSSLPLTEQPDFYSRVLNSFGRLSDYFDMVCRDDPQIQGPPCTENDDFRKLLSEHAMTTEQLQLIYLAEVSQPLAPQDFINAENNGEIAFRIAHETIHGLVTISVMILSCRNLPKMDFIGSSDPYVILELLPSSIYHKTNTEYRTTVQNRTLNPEFNELFNWHRLPLSILNERGAVLRLSVWDKDFVHDDFIGECFVPLSKTSSLKSVAGLRDVPVTEIRLKRPHRHNQPRILESIRKRSSFDKQADEFVKKRFEVMASGKDGVGTSLNSEDQNSPGSYATAAFHMLLGMLPINFDIGQKKDAH